MNTRLQDLKIRIPFYPDQNPYTLLKLRLLLDHHVAAIQIKFSLSYFQTSLKSVYEPTSYSRFTKGPSSLVVRGTLLFFSSYCVKSDRLVYHSHGTIMPYNTHTPTKPIIRSLKAKPKLIDEILFRYTQPVRNKKKKKKKTTKKTTFPLDSRRPSVGH